MLKSVLGLKPKETMRVCRSYLEMLAQCVSTTVATSLVGDVYKRQKLGDVINAEIFNDVAYVDVIGTSKGKGFQGVVKRHNFGGVGQTTHGQKNRLRAPGSIGACATPSKVVKGMRMAGQDGNRRVTIENLRVIKVLPEQNALVVKGSVPGAKGTILLVNI